jgi:3-dehydroquinate synthase
MQQSHLLTLHGTQFAFNAAFNDISNFATKEKILLLIDEVVYAENKSIFENYTFILVKAGESHKVQNTVDNVIAQMLELNIDKSYILVGVGGGTVTDMAGYIASIYKRGIGLGLVPTSILGMVDAAIGGKNGVNVGMYKNMVGTTYRPKFILFCYSFLEKLPRLQWINGFAEIIKHACIQDEAMFNALMQHNIDYYIENANALQELVQHNVQLKMNIVIEDEFENADRFLLNFGHSFGHAIENVKELPHGFAISVGMHLAALVSEELVSFPKAQTQQLLNLLEKYELPTAIPFSFTDALQILQKDKKRNAAYINYVTLHNIGKASFKKIELASLQFLEDTVNSWK